MKYHIDFDIDFKKNPYKGLYIALEGIDGSGKTAQAEKISKYFHTKGVKVLNVREPRKGVGVVGKLIQEILIGRTKVPPVTLQYLYTADRTIHHNEVIIPALKKGATIVSDRCLWSAVPYGILDRRETIDEDAKMQILVSQSILSMYHQFIIPDCTFYLDISVDEAMERIKKKHGEKREIYEKREHLEKILKGYKLLLREFPDEFTVINGRKPIEEVTAEIVKTISSIT